MSNIVKAICGTDFGDEVLMSSIPVVVNVWTPWCGPCMVAAPMFENAASKFVGRAKFVKVHFDEEKDVVNQYGVIAIPTFLFFNKGILRFKTEGFGAPSLQIWETFLQKLIS